MEFVAPARAQGKVGRMVNEWPGTASRGGSGRSKFMSVTVTLFHCWKVEPVVRECVKTQVESTQEDSWPDRDEFGAGAAFADVAPRKVALGVEE